MWEERVLVCRLDGEKTERGRVPKATDATPDFDHFPWQDAQNATLIWLAKKCAATRRGYDAIDNDGLSKGILITNCPIEDFKIHITSRIVNLLAEREFSLYLNRPRALEALLDAVNCDNGSYQT